MAGIKNILRGAGIKNIHKYIYKHPTGVNNLRKCLTAKRSKNVGEKNYLRSVLHPVVDGVKDVKVRGEVNVVRPVRLSAIKVSQMYTCILVCLYTCILVYSYTRSSAHHQSQSNVYMYTCMLVYLYTCILVRLRAVKVSQVQA